MRDIGHRDLGWLALFVVFIRLVVNKVDIALDLMVLHNRDDERADRRAERRLQILEHFVEVGVLRVHFVDKEHFRFAHRIGQLIRLLRADGHARTRGNNDQNALGRPHALIHAGGEVEQSRRIDQIDLNAAPCERRDRT